MSGNWTTQAWRTGEINEALITSLLHAFLEVGCLYQNPHFKEPRGSAIVSDGMEVYEGADIEALSKWLMAKGGGAAQLWYALDSETYIEFLIGYNNKPIGTYQGNPIYEIWLSIDYTYLHRDPLQQIEIIYQLLFKWSHLLARHVQAFLAMGDSDPADVYPVLERGVDVATPQILKIGWWTYYNDAWAKAIGEHRLYSYATWAVHRDSQGLAIIMAPPGVPMRGNRSNDAHVFVE